MTASSRKEVTTDMLGDNIAALRKKQGLSQQELAERIHVVRQTVSKWEKKVSLVKGTPRQLTLTLLVHNKENKHMKLITCDFYMDSGCVELRFDDGTALDIDCTAV